MFWPDPDLTNIQVIIVVFVYLKLLSVCKGNLISIMNILKNYDWRTISRNSIYRKMIDLGQMYFFLFWMVLNGWKYWMNKYYLKIKVYGSYNLTGKKDVWSVLIVQISIEFSFVKVKLHTRNPTLGYFIHWFTIKSISAVTFSYPPIIRNNILEFMICLC